MALSPYHKRPRLRIGCAQEVHFFFLKKYLAFFLGTPNKWLLWHFWGFAYEELS
jgi:hypothetical protein